MQQAIYPRKNPRFDTDMIFLHQGFMAVNGGTRTEGLGYQCMLRFNA